MFSTHPDRPALDRGLTVQPRPDDPLHPHPLFHHWQALVDAGLIGGNPPLPAAVAEQLAANDALFRRLAVARRRERVGW